MPEPPRPGSAPGPVATDARGTWAAGDFARVATGQTIVGEILCESVALHAREHVLDVATGSGNTALAAARRRATVVGVDFVPELLERARARAGVEGLAAKFREGRAEALPFEPGAFDVVLSTFGAMFSESPERCAGELLRVCRPGGRIGLASWTPDGFVGRLFRATARHAPALASVDRSTRWGTEDGLRALLGPAAGALRTVRREFAFRADSAEAYVGFFRRFFGPTVTAFAALAEPQQEALEAELLGIVREANTASDGTVFVPSAYLEAVLVRPGADGPRGRVKSPGS